MVEVSEDEMYDEECQEYDDEIEGISLDENTQIKPENFKLSELPIFLNSDSYSYRDIHSEVRMREFINMYPPLKDKNYIIMSSIPFSYRFSNWMSNSSTSMEVWGERQFYMTNVYPLSIDKVKLRPDNRLIRIDHNIYYLFYKESTIAKTYRICGLVFVNGEVPWDSEKIRKWIIYFSKKLKDFEDEDRNKIMKPNAFDGIFLPENIMSDIKSEIEDFLSSRESYKNDLKLPWKRGYMLIGPPGTGKTSIIRAICNYYGLRSYDIQEAIQKDGTINLDTFTYSRAIDMILYPPENNPIICIIEDVDKFVVYQSGGSKGNADAGRVTLHDILKALDGLNQYDGVIVIATTNYARDMSEAILNRPGRFDRIWKIDLPTEENILKLLRYHNVSIIDNNLSLISKGLKGFSMAFVAEFIKGVKTKFRRNEVSYDEAKSILDQIHQHNKTYLDYFRDKDKDHRNTGESVGFGS